MKKITAITMACFAVWKTAAADFEVRIEIEFRKCIPVEAKVKKLAGRFKFTEGPVWISGKDAYLIFSDIPANHLKKWTQAEGVTVFREDSHNANGNTVDRKHRLITAEHAGRRISMTENDGTIKTLVAEFEGKKFNSPNDVVVKSDGTIWFTDPDYGLGGNKKEQNGNFVFRFDPKSAKTTAVVKDFDKPNGICFSPDEKRLYVADSGAPHHIRVFDVTKEGTVTNGKVFCVLDRGVPDGIRCDAKGHVWSSAGDGVHIFSPDGVLVGKILLPETAANLCFGGNDGKTLFVTAQTSLYAIQTTVRGVR